MKLASFEAVFPADFGFQVRRQEFANLMFQFGTSNSPGGRRKLPWVFTEHGAIMAATIHSGAGRDHGFGLCRPMNPE